MPENAVPDSPSARIDARIAELDDWRGEVLARVRAVIHAADPGVVEEWKWRGVPVWEDDGIICTGETYKDKVKLTFHKGAALEDPAGLFNSSLDGNTRRAIDIREGDPIDEAALAALVQAAARLNATRRPVGARGKVATEEPVLLSGGNPQIPKGYGEAPVAAYMDALPGWKRDVGWRIDAIVTANMPGVRKAVKWNSPFYGLAGQGWLVSVHALTKYLKVTFFCGPSLDPVPPGGTRDDGRWVDVYEDALDEAQLAEWVRQAAGLPGWVTSDIEE